LFAGHLAAALAAKRAAPGVPLSVGVAAAYALDLVWPILLLLGVETVRVNPGDTAFTHLAFVHYPWTHSLALALVWSGLAGLLGRVVLRSRRAGGIVGALVLSHWVLDWLTHRPDLPLWPGGTKAGLGLWYSIPGTIVVEGGLFVAGIWLYTTTTDATDRTGTISLIALLALVGLVWITQPWTPPPPSSTAVAWGAMALWVLPLWAIWIERHRRSSGFAT
jgi:membrane-bound metal-dependent hydrolase YbcI (DUF457 family)